MGSDHPNPKYVPIVQGSVAQPQTLQMSHRLSPTLPTHPPMHSIHGAQWIVQINRAQVIYLFFLNGTIQSAGNIKWFGEGRGGEKSGIYFTIKYEIKEFYLLNPALQIEKRPVQFLHNVGYKFNSRTPCCQRWAPACSPIGTPHMHTPCTLLHISCCPGTC